MRGMMYAMKRKVVWLGALLLAVLLLCAVAMAAVYPCYTTTNDQVNLRRSASTSSTLLSRIPKGAEIEVLGESGDYYQVRYNGQTGYVVKQYVNALPEAASVTTKDATAAAYPYETTTNDQVNLRSQKSTSSSRLDSIPKGATITVHSVSGSYAEVTYDGKTGWCLKKYVNLKEIVKPTATPKPTASPAPEEQLESYQLLQLGSTGSHVTALQEAMVELGFLSGAADGVFGDGTLTAVLAFQAMNEYPVTGIVDPNLQAFLYVGKPKNSQGEKTELKTLPPIEGVSIRLNDRGQIVRTVQLYLKELGYYTGAISGEYDKTTRSAVIAFQKKNGLTADGICGVETQGILLEGKGLAANATATPKPTATPVPTTPAPTFQVPSDSVRRGDKGANVKLVQQRLIELGYLTGKADGIFGSDSEKALKAFQIKHGLEDDGVAGGSTYTILFSHDALGVNEMVTPAPTMVPTASPTPALPTMTPPVMPETITKDNVVTIRLKTKGDAVLSLQYRLTQLGYYQSILDGECKADDVAAIKAFQRRNNLDVDGVAGYDTQKKLYSMTAVTNSGEMAGATADANQTLRKGDTGEAVREVQEQLIMLGYLAAGSADGIYGVSTAEAVYNFQKRNDLVRDGVAGTKTLVKLFSVAAVKPTPAPTQKVPTPEDATIIIATNKTLRKGDVSEAVKAMQERLIELKYLSGEADGKFGLQTYEALKAFQKANDLDVDGVAGKVTLDMLNSVNAQSAPSAGGTISTPTMSPSVSTMTISAADVQYENWYSVIRAKARKFQYATVYDYETGISWQVHMFSFGAHADAEPLTPTDTAKMERAFGGNTWNPKPVWVLLGNGEVYIATTHSMEHDVQHITTNDFNGHVCIHFPRTQAQVTAIGPYATSHQRAVEKGWAATQAMVQ